jgi:hypothetical protein
LERAETQEERDTIHRDWGRSIANFFSPTVQNSLAAISKQVDWDQVTEVVRVSQTDWDRPVEVVVVPDAWRTESDTPTVASNNEANLEPELAIPLRQLIGSSGTRLQLVSYRTSGNGVSDKVDEVATFLFSNTDIGQLQIVLNKVEQIAP